MDSVHERGFALETPHANALSSHTYFIFILNKIKHQNGGLSRKRSHDDEEIPQQLSSSYFRSYISYAITYVTGGRFDIKTLIEFIA